jgi:hypothetical protein
MPAAPGNATTAPDAPPGRDFDPQEERVTMTERSDAPPEFDEDAELLEELPEWEDDLPEDLGDIGELVGPDEDPWD